MDKTLKFLKFEQYHIFVILFLPFDSSKFRLVVINYTQKSKQIFTHKDCSK